MSTSRQANLLTAPGIGGDIWGGFAAMLVALPSAIAFGVTIFSPLGAEFGAKGALAGMLGATALGLIAAIFGGTQRLISAPCAPAAAVLSALTIQLSQQGLPASAIVLTLFLVALASSAAQILFGVLRIGQLIKYMPFPVVSGYLSGVGLIIILSQLPKWLSLPKGTSWWQGLMQPSLWQLPGLLIGGATAGAMLLAPRISQRIPAVIQGLIAGIAMYWLLALSNWPELRSLAHNDLVIGQLSTQAGGFLATLSGPWSSLSSAALPRWDLVLVPALTLSVLLSIDTLKTCLVLDALTGTRHNANRELVGQGLGNLVSTLIGGAPGAGTMGATLVNKASGGTTAWSGIFQGLWSLLAVLLLTPLIAWVPVPALAALLIVIGIRMIDWKSLQMVRSRDTILDFLVIAVVVLVANTVSLIAASGLGVALAALMYISEQIHTSTVRRKSFGSALFSKRIRSTVERQILEREGAKSVVFELQGSLFFGTTDQLYSAIEAELQGARYVMLDFFRVQSLDLTAGHMIERIRNMLSTRQATLVLSRLPERLPNGRDLRSYVEHIGLLSDGLTKVFDEFSDALEWLEDEILKEAGVDIESPHALQLAEFEIFKHLSAAEMRSLQAIAHTRNAAAGELVLRAGTAGQELLLIAQGELKVSLSLRGGKSIHLATLGRGQFLGEMSFLDGWPYSADVHALADTALICIGRQALDAIVANDERTRASIFKTIAMAIAARLRHTNAELREIREA